MSGKVDAKSDDEKTTTISSTPSANGRSASFTMTRSPTTEETRLEYMSGQLTVVVIGASGDLAKKKTYPALFGLYIRNMLPSNIRITGYARSKKTNADLRNQIKPFLVDKFATVPTESIEAFLALCDYYVTPGYDSIEGMKQLSDILDKREHAKGGRCNRLFYLAVPPFVFVGASTAIREHGVSETGWTRIVVEKPFGRDTKSSNELSSSLAKLFDERYLYRIDHYLGKEMVQSLLTLRFANQFFEPIWNHRYISCVYISFKEPFGTEGRGGYFDRYGIIRDVIQNHLLQVLSLVAMEPPIGPSGNAIRDKKVELLRCIQRIKPNEVVLGQYKASADGKKPGYLDDKGVPKDSRTPTFASVVLRVCNRRWNNVPFIVRAGKALNQRKVEVRVQFKATPATSLLFPGQRVPRNELVIRLQPNEALFMRTAVKAPGIGQNVVQSELDLTYADRYGSKFDNPDAYTRMLLNVLRGDQSTFVRDDELRVAWEIFTPLLNRIEKNASIRPILYEYGSRGPSEADEMAIRVGYDRETLQKRLAAGPRDNRSRGGSLTEQEFNVYIGKSPGTAKY